MEEMNYELLNEIIKETAPLGSDQFSNLFEAIREVKRDLEDFHQEEILEFMQVSLNLENEAEMIDLTEYEKESLAQFINQLY